MSRPPVLALFLFLGALASNFSPSFAKDAPPVPPMSGRVVDLAGALPADREAALTERLRAFEARKGAQVAVLVIETAAPEGALSDLVSKKIIEDILIPQFRAGDIPGGIESAVDAMLKVIDGEPLPEPDAISRGERDGGGGGGASGRW